MIRFYFVLGFILSLSINSAADTCQSGAWVTQEIVLGIDSGFIFGDQTKASISKAVYQQEIKVPGAVSLRLFFYEVALPEDGESFLRVRSLKDGKVQTHSAETLRQWRNSSACGLQKIYQLLIRSFLFALFMHKVI